ncbi:MAG: ribonuclease P protein component [Hyphomicrobiales bacterium]|nr:MAG: ribonuclease P protein component [Hyphomicrobiales bacterium]
MRLARLTQRKQFLAAADQGRRFRSSAFTVQVRDADADEEREPAGLRLGLTASRKVGNAVKRNRIRRRLRVAAAEALAAQADRRCDIVIVARSETLKIGFRMLVNELSVAIDRARPAGQGRKPRSSFKPDAGKSAGSNKSADGKPPAGTARIRDARPSSSP